MGVMLREVLRAFCSGNQWRYAVFWKIGCQNTNLLIWEECHYEPTECSELPLGEWGNCWGSSEANSSRLSVQSLVNKMMMNNQINLLGEGMVGRAAFTGDHQWILANNYIADPHPPEVQNEVQLQFSAGMQTVAVIPVLPHGVVQLGSSSAIMENIGFVNYVKSLIMQLGCVPGALLSENYGTTEPIQKPVLPISDAMFVSGEPSGSFNMPDSIPSLGENYTHHNFSYQPSSQVGRLSGSQGQQLRRNAQTTATHTLSRAEVIPSNSDAWLNQQASLYNSRSGLNDQSSMGQSCIGGGSLKEKQIVMDNVVNGFDNSCFGTLQSRKGAGIITRNDLGSRKEIMDNDLFQALNSSFSYSDEHISSSEKIPTSVHGNGGIDPEPSNLKFEMENTQISSGDDLFDVLGADFKSKLLNASWYNNVHDDSQNPSKEASSPINVQDVNSDFYSVSEGTEHLLDAVVSRAYSSSKQISDDNSSCKTTVTKISSSHIPSSSTSCGQFNRSNLLQGDLYGFPSKTMTKANGTAASSSFRSGSSKDDTGSCSQTTSIYGSHISSWVEQGRDVKHDASVSTGYSKKNDPMTKSNRKRLKPGENPRPRPKDRQMIQDRVKELREIVPNGAKCSIDALLERTIKHMLFLQSVTKHADKLKQTGESKIINNEGGLLSKDNFEGGATWAFEVGSQSMVCPIIVEDLNPPRQMLVEMLCEERGFFLEIADLIRGMGLTILKGVMEARNDKIWARFAVEANRDVTRMEIFMSLVQLLEQTVKGSSFTNALDSSNMMINHSFPQATSIPATGRPSSLH